MKLSIRCMPGYQDTAKSGRKSEPLRALKKTPRRSLKRKKAINNEVDDLLIVGVPGFEPGASCSQNRYANRTALYPEEHCKSVLKLMAETAGFEPAVPL
jgi:hypothetical protein